MNAVVSTETPYGSIALGLGGSDLGGDGSGQESSEIELSFIHDN